MSHDRPTSTPRTIGFPKARPSVGDHPRSANGERTSAARLGRSLQAASNASQARHRPTTDHAPKVTRPKGRVFISFVILSVVGTVASGLWNEFFRFQAYGTIEGRVVKISAPWAGIVESLHVKDGQYVQPGELLATLQNTELKLRLGKLRDEILLAHAAFESRVAELKATHREDAERILRVHVDYFELVSQYQSDKSKLDALRSDYRRLSLLGPDGIIAAGEIESARFALEGQAARVAELKSAVDRMQQGLGDATLMEGPHKLLSLEKSRLATLISEWQRLVDFEQLGEIRAPTGGRIVQRHCFTGEYVPSATAIFDLLEEGSLHAVLYMPQRKAASLSAGDSISLNLPPLRSNLTFRVERLGEQMVPAPPSLKRYYPAGARLVRVAAAPLADERLRADGSDSMRLGAEVRMPRFNRWRGLTGWSAALVTAPLRLAEEGR